MRKYTESCCIIFLWAYGKTPRVSKDKVKFLHRASIAEVCFTDTFETDYSKFRYGQAVVDYRSRYGDIIPIKSRKKVGWAFGEFCNRHFVPKILIRDNIPENIECPYMSLYIGAELCGRISRQDNSHGLFCYGILWGTHSPMDILYHMCGIYQ